MLDSGTPGWRLLCTIALYLLGQLLFLVVCSKSSDSSVFLSTAQDKLSKSVNMRAMNMLGKAEEKVLTYIACNYTIVTLYVRTCM